MDNKALKKLEADLWESADLLRAGSKLTSNQYCMPVLGLLFLRYAYSRFKMVETEILKDRPMRRGVVMPVEASDFKEKSALFLPKEAQYEYLVNLPEDVKKLGLTGINGQPVNSLGEAVNNAMELVEIQSEQLDIGARPINAKMKCEYDRYRKRAFEGNKEILMDALTSTNSNATVIGIAAVVKNKPDDDTETTP